MKYIIIFIAFSIICNASPVIETGIVNKEEAQKLIGELTINSNRSDYLKLWNSKKDSSISIMLGASGIYLSMQYVDNSNKVKNVKHFNLNILEASKLIQKFILDWKFEGLKYRSIKDW